MQLVQTSQTAYRALRHRQTGEQLYENLYSPKNGRNNNELTNSTVQINSSKVTQIMTPTINVNEHRTYTNLLHILHNRLSEA